MPLDPADDTSSFDVLPDTVAPYLYKESGVGDSAASIIPKAREALKAVRGLARRDGFFVYELTIDDSVGFDKDKDLDELAYVVSMVVKDGSLRHTHYHHNMPGKGRARRLKPTQILMIPPVQIAAANWLSDLGSATLTGDMLRAALCERVPAGKQARQALVHFRYRYLRVSDRVAFRIRAHRAAQWELAPWIKFTSGAGLGLATLGLILLAMPDQWSSFRPPHLIFGAILTAGIGYAIYFRQRIARWDIPVVCLLRTAHGFYTAASPLNELLKTLVPRSTVGDFGHIRDNLHSRLEGEQHRIQVGHGWLAVCLGICGLVAAIAALDLNRRSAEAAAAGLSGQAAEMRDIVRARSAQGYIGPSFDVPLNGKNTLQKIDRPTP